MAREQPSIAAQVNGVTDHITFVVVDRECAGQGVREQRLGFERSDRRCGRGALNQFVLNNVVRHTQQSNMTTPASLAGLGS